MATSAEVLCACCHGAEIHAACAHAYTHEGHYHDTKWPGVRIRSIVPAVSERCKEVACAEEDSRQSGKRARVIAVAEVSKERDGKVHGQLGGDGDCIDLELSVAKTSLKERRIE